MSCAITGGLTRPHPRLLAMERAEGRWKELISYLDQAPAGSVIGLCRQHDPVLSLLPWHAYLGLVRTLDILADPELGPAVRRGMTQASGGMSDMKAAGEEGLDRVLLTPQAQADLAAVNSGRSGARLLKSLASLHRSKEEAATLAGPLAGCFCRDVVGEHFRIIYNPDLGGGRLAVLAIGRLKHGGERNAEKLLEPNL